MLNTPLLAFFFSLIVSAAVAPLVIKFYRKHNWIDDPSSNHHVKKTHTQAVPRGGGIVIFTAVLLGVLLFLDLDKHLYGILGGAFILMIVGYLDDVKDLHPLLRLFTGFLAALMVVGAGIGIAYINHPLGAGIIHLDQPQIALTLFGEHRNIWILADLFGLFFILWNMNIVNWSKGVDGQMPGFVMIALIFIGILSQRFSGDPAQFSVQTLSFIVAGAFGGLLIWNMYPQKIMPGYGAGSLAGFFLSVVAILGGAKVATALMVLAIPTADAIFTITRRIIAGKSPWWGDRGHLHHKLMDVLGWNKVQVAVFYWLTSLCMGILSLYLNTQGKMITMAIAATLVFGFLVWAKLQQSKKKS